MIKSNYERGLKAEAYLQEYFKSKGIPTRKSKKLDVLGCDLIVELDPIQYWDAKNHTESYMFQYNPESNTVRASNPWRDGIVTTHFCIKKDSFKELITIDNYFSKYLKDINDRALVNNLIKEKEQSCHSYKEFVIIAKQLSAAIAPYLKDNVSVNIFDSTDKDTGFIHGKMNLKNN